MYCAVLSVEYKTSNHNSELLVQVMRLTVFSYFVFLCFVQAFNFFSNLRSFIMFCNFYINCINFIFLNYDINIKYLNHASDGMFLCTLHPVAAITNSSAVSPLSPCRKTMSLSALVSLLFSFSLNFLTFLFSGGCGFIG